MKKLILILTLFCLVGSSTVFAQISPEAARAEIQKRGLDENEVRQRLLMRGVDIDKVDPTSPGEVQRAQQMLEEVVKELEEEQTKEDLDQKLEETQDEAIEQQIKEVARETDNISDAIKDGATLEEAVSEELIDAQEDLLPDAVVYGQEIFRNKSIKLFRKSEDIKPEASYILGVGDKLTVAIWGYSQENLTFEINKSGYIKPPELPRIYLKGIRFDKAKELIESRFAQYYRFRSEEFEITLNFARTINVNIVGEVYNYGSFNLPAINTAFNALAAAGGPSNIGSVRNIKLFRGGEAPKTIDIYKFLLNPDAKNELYLEENDYIHVPVAEKIISIAGAVKRPFKYELIKGEDLKELIFYAGGAKENAYLQNVQIKRYVDDEETILDINLRELNKSARNFELFNGDQVIINTISMPYKNFVTVDGAVEIEGKFEVTNGMRLTELIGKARLLDETRTDIAYVQRTNTDGTVKYIKVSIDEAIANAQSDANLLLEPKDRLIIADKRKFVDNSTFSIEGAVRNPIELKLETDQTLRISDAIFLAGGLRYDATDFAYIHRGLAPNQEKEKEYVRVNIKEIMENPNSSENRLIEANDRIMIYSTLSYIDNFSIEVSGSVRNPGAYQFDESLKLQDVLTMAGGLKFEAAANKVDIYRLEIGQDKNTRTVAATLEVDETFNIIDGNANFELRPFDQIVVRNAPEFELQQVVSVRGEVKYPGAYALIDENETIASIVKRAGNITDEAFPSGATLYRPNEGVGYIVINLDEVIRNPKARSNFILKAGDELIIPKRKDFVVITGATRMVDLYPEKVVQSKKVNVAYHQGKNAKFYVNEYAAGIGEDGRRRLITVEHPNGEIKRTKNFVLFRIYPKVRKGSVVKVGKVKKKESRMNNGEEKEKVDWGQVLGTTITQTTAVLSLILLIQNIN